MMQQQLIDTTPSSASDLELARNAVRERLGILELNQGDLVYLNTVLDSYAEKPKGDPASVTRDVLTYVENCLIQNSRQNGKNRREANLKKYRTALDSIRTATLAFARIASGEDLGSFESEQAALGDDEAMHSQQDSSKRANELDGATWLRYSVSVWDDISKSQDEQAFSHPAMFPSELPDRLIRMFTRADSQGTILDPFMGSGSTLVAAVENGKEGVGFEIYDKFIELSERRLSGTLNFSGKERRYRIIKDDARTLARHLARNSVDLCITSPPYWDILSQKRTADYKEKRPYGELEQDLGEVREYGAFLAALKDVFSQVFLVLKPGAYCVVNVMDLRKQSSFFAYHMDITNFMREAGFILDDIIIWNRAREYNNLRPLGYPFVFRVNKVHEFLLIFMKPRH